MCSPPMGYKLSQPVPRRVLLSHEPFRGTPASRWNRGCPLNPPGPESPGSDRMNSAGYEGFGETELAAPRAVEAGPKVALSQHSPHHQATAKPLHFAGQTPAVHQATWAGSVFQRAVLPFNILAALPSRPTAIQHDLPGTSTFQFPPGEDSRHLPFAPQTSAQPWGYLGTRRALKHLAEFGPLNKPVPTALHWGTGLSPFPRSQEF